MYIYQSTDENKVTALVLAACLVLGLFAVALITIPFVLRSYRTIQRFRHGILIEPPGRRQGTGRRRDWALGWLAVGAGSISLMWAGVCVWVILVTFLPNRAMSALNVGEWLELVEGP